MLLAVIAAAVVLVISHQGNGSGHDNRTASHHGSTKHGKGSGKKNRSGSIQIDPTKVTVSVLNGTSTQNLAADVSAKLNHAGFQQGETTNYTDETQTTTSVGYLPGFSAQAYAVAKALHLNRSDVAKVNTDARSIACAATPTTCPDQVVVTVGADLESDA